MRLLTRIAPPMIFGSRRAALLVERNIYVYRRTMLVIFSGFFKLNYEKTYDAVLATPLGVGDVALGEIAWALIRGTLYAIGFLAVMLVLGLVVSPWMILAIPAAVL